MAADTEFISRKDFNSKFKNYLRDFYVYQFKNKHVDFFNTGSFSRSRMVAVIIACTVDENIQIEDFFRVKMSDIDMSGSSVSIKITQETTNRTHNDIKRTVIIKKPLSEMFKYLQASETAFFITGNTAPFSDAGREKLKLEDESFKRFCPSPVTEEKMYHYWGQIYIEEANEAITTSTYSNDSVRLQTLINQMANVKWAHGCKIDYKNEGLSGEDDSCIECVTADTRELKNNPFHILYRYCNRYNNSDKDIFGLLLALIMYFSNEKIFKRCAMPSLSSQRLSSLETYLEDQATILFNRTNNRSDIAEEKRRSQKVWKIRHSSQKDAPLMTSKQKNRYGSKIAAQFLVKGFETFKSKVCLRFKEAYGIDYSWNDIKDDKRASKIILETIQKYRTFSSEDYLDVFLYLVESKKKIIFNGQRFEIVNSELIEKQLLFIAVFEFINCGEKQFTNIVREFSQTGLIGEYRKLFVRCADASGDYIDKDTIEKVLSDYQDEYDFTLIEEAEDGVYTIRYSYAIDKDVVCRLKKDLLSVCKECRESERVYFGLSSYNIKQILGDDKDLAVRFSEMVSFFSQTALLGEVGDYVSDRLPPSAWKMFYKHNYIVKALNDYNNIDLLYAMQNPSPQNHYWIEIECRDALGEVGYQHFVCYPIEIRENVSDGQQHLIYYHPVYRSIASIRIDFIDRVVVCRSTTKLLHFGPDIERAHKLIKCTWGLHFADFYEGNVKSDPHPSEVTFTIQFKNEHEVDGKKVSENFIKDRIRREIDKEVGCFKEEKLNETHSLLKITVSVINPFDMIHWIRTYTKRICNIKIEYSSFMDDVERAKKMYSWPTPERVLTTLDGGDNRVLYSNDVKFIPIESKSERLFNEFYCETFRKLAKTLGQMVLKGNFDQDFADQLRRSYVGIPKTGKRRTKTEEKQYESRENQFNDLLNKFTRKEFNRYTSIYSISDGTNLTSIYELIPLTDIEVQWLINILSHKLARAFLSSSEIENIQARLPKMKWFDVFDSETVKLSDRHSETSLEEYYDKVQKRDVDINNETCFVNADYGIIIRKMMQAIQGKRVVEVTYCSQYGTTTDYTFVPYCVEYSKRDNRFRVKAVCKTRDRQKFYGVRTFPVDLISSYKETEEVVPGKIINDNVNNYKGLNADGTKIPVEKRNKRNRGGTREVVVHFSDCDGVPDKILTEFSCYEKTCVRWGNGRYRMALTYYEEDCNEIVIRLLGYGSLITVTSVDDSDPVVKELVKRYENQVDLYKERVGKKGEQEKNSR